MTAVLLIIHVLIAAALTGVILMQRSEGGALGIGGGGPGGMMSGRGAANLLTRITMILGALFIGNSILLAILSGVTTSTGSVLDRVGQSETSSDLPFGDLQGLDADAIDAPEATIPAEPAPADDAPTEDEPSAELPNR
ncbi:preprotein translocase subunit SecG [Oceanicaulis sp. UBA2681]|uniref:preprotein translocase subunit SecG n=1 Tax=Oceanicaulis sp. UBA2681 TaxID=1947007 RepID=UPI002579BC2E|nr:preprotein translocase subunit SecG [Oceanicaulis sp. UBA2681]|tara:strand:+ start:3024 stop:3437 length:414 start_codon:yes stop_codon:yes gene_type:complete